MLSETSWNIRANSPEGLSVDAVSAAISAWLEAVTGVACGEPVNVESTSLPMNKTVGPPIMITMHQNNMLNVRDIGFGDWNLGRRRHDFLLCADSRENSSNKRKYHEQSDERAAEDHPGDSAERQ